MDEWLPAPLPASVVAEFRYWSSKDELTLLPSAISPAGGKQQMSSKQDKCKRSGYVAVIIDIKC